MMFSAWVRPGLSKLKKWYAPTSSPASRAPCRFVSNVSSTKPEPSVAFTYAKSTSCPASTGQSIVALVGGHVDAAHLVLRSEQTVGPDHPAHDERGHERDDDEDDRGGDDRDERLAAGVHPREVCRTTGRGIDESRSAVRCPGA